MIFTGLIALLSFCAGLLGNHFLYGEKTVEPISIIVVDEDNTFESKAFYTILTGVDAYKDFISFEKADKPAALAMIKENKATAIFTIPKNFTEQVKNGENMPYEVVYNAAAPVKSALIRYFSECFAKMLMVSQTGVYAGLDYARDNGSREEYESVFEKVNLRYMALIMGRGDMAAVKEVSVTGKAPVFQTYLFSAYVFIMMAGIILFADIFQKNFNKMTLLALSKTGNGCFKLSLLNILSFFTMLVFINVPLLALLRAVQFAVGYKAQYSVMILAVAALFWLCVGSIGVLLSFLFRNTLPTGVFSSIFALVSLFVSGGIVPAEYFPDYLASMSRFTINYWTVKLLNNCMAGEFNGDGILPMLAYIIVPILLTMALLNHKGKAGGTL